MKKRKSVIHRCKVCHNTFNDKKLLIQHTATHSEEELFKIISKDNRYPEIYLFLLQHPGYRNYDVKKSFPKNYGTDAYLANMRDHNITIMNEIEADDKVASKNPLYMRTRLHKKSTRSKEVRNYPNMDLLLSYLFKHRMKNINENLKMKFTKFLKDEKFYPAVFSYNTFRFFRIIDDKNKFKQPIFESIMFLINDLFLLAFNKFGFPPIPYTLEDYEKIKELSKRMDNDELLKIYERSGKCMFNDFYRSYALRFKKFSKEFIEQSDEEHRLLTKNTFETFLRKIEKNKERNKKEIEKYGIEINW